MFSKPTYRKLDLDSTGRSHLIAGVAEGRLAMNRVAEQARALDTVCTVVYDSDPDADLTERLIAFFSTASMGLRVYFSGPESFLWAAMRAAAPFGFGKDEIQLELAGRGRDVYCVHCKQITSGVEAATCTCSHCGTLLRVREHFSRRLGCYMGVWDQN